MKTSRSSSAGSGPFAVLRRNIGILHTCVVALALSGCDGSDGQRGPASPNPRARPVEIEGFASPEGVVGVGSRRFVSNMGVKLEPMTKDGDGFISEVDDSGRIVELRALPQGAERLDAPKGMAIIGSRLFVADIDRVVGFDLERRARVFEAAIGGGDTLLNDLAVENDETLLVTDTVRGALYRLRIIDRSFVEVAHGIVGANGVTVDPTQRLAWVVGLGDALGGGRTPGNIHRVPLDGGGVTTLEGHQGLFDGVGFLATGALVVSDWVALTEPSAGKLIVLGQAEHRASPPFAGHGPADFWVDREHGRVWVPRTLDHRVTVLETTAW